MSTHLASSGNIHDIDVEETAEQLAGRRLGRFTHPVDHPTLWHPGDSVAIKTSDRQRFLGTVLDVSYVTKAVLIELN